MAYYPEGNYQVVVTDQGLGENYRRGANDYVFIRFVVKATERGVPVDKEYEREWQKALTEKTIPHLGKDFKSLGIDVTSFLKLAPDVPGFVDLRGKELVLTCKHNGKYEDWEPVFKGGGSLPETKKVSKDRYVELHKKFGTAFAAAMADEESSLPF